MVLSVYNKAYVVLNVKQDCGAVVLNVQAVFISEKNLSYKSY